MPPEREEPLRDDPSLESILEQAAWVQRLARGLLADVHEAEDLSQEVLAVALERRPDLDLPRLRGWLRTVARRLVARQRERARARAWVERESARPEALEERSNERLRWQRRLAEALEALPDPYRTALVLRYLEDLPPR